MKKFNVTVCRIVREETTITVEAETEAAAVGLAMDDAVNMPPHMWNCYDCEYFSDEGDIKVSA